MILKNAIVLKALLPEIGLLRQQLEAADWQGIGETEFRRDTFVPGHTGDLVADFPTGYALRLRCEEKIIPQGAIEDAVLQREAEIQKERGEELGKSEYDALREDVSLDLCKKAFVKSKYVEAFYHTASELLIVNTTSPGEVQRFMGTLVKLAGKVQTVTIHISNVKNGVTARLQSVIEGEDWSDDDTESLAPFGQLTTDDVVRLKRKMEAGEPDEMVTYKGTWLADNDELLHQLRSGFEVEEIGLSYPPAAMSFRLTHQFRFKGIDFEPQEPEDDGAEIDFAHEWRMAAMREVDGLVEVVNELCALMEYEQPVLEAEAPDGDGEDAGEDEKEAETPALAPAPVDNEQDPLYAEAEAFVLKSQQASVSDLQCQFKIDHNRAFLLIKELERAGVVCTGHPDPESITHTERRTT